MPLMLDDLRQEFARHLGTDPAARWRMDGALAHVLTLAFNAGMAEAEAMRLPSAITWMPLGAETGWNQAHRLALELEALLLSCNDHAAVSKWWDSAHEALAQYRQAANQAPELAGKLGAGETAPENEINNERIHQ